MTAAPALAASPPATVKMRTPPAVRIVWLLLPIVALLALTGCDAAGWLVQNQVLCYPKSCGEWLLQGDEDPRPPVEKHDH